MCPPVRRCPRIPDVADHLLAPRCAGWRRSTGWPSHTAARPISCVCRPSGRAGRQARIGGGVTFAHLAARRLRCRAHPGAHGAAVCVALRSTWIARASLRAGLRLRQRRRCWSASSHVSGAVHAVGRCARAAEHRTVHSGRCVRPLAPGSKVMRPTDPGARGARDRCADSGLREPALRWQLWVRCAVWFGAGQGELRRPTALACSNKHWAGDPAADWLARRANQNTPAVQ